MTGVDIVALLVFIALFASAIPLVLKAMLYQEADGTQERGERR